jgi:hypothetical protein
VIILTHVQCLNVVFMLQAVNKYDSVDKIPINRKLIQRYQSAHSVYTAELAKCTTEKRDSEAQQIEKRERELTEKKKSDAVHKQKLAETLITEANDRLTQAATAQNMVEILAAQALLQSGSVQLMEARKELEALDTLPVAKKLKK